MRLLISLLLAATGLAGGVVEERVEHLGVRYRVVRLQAADLELVWKGKDGQPFATFDRVRSHFARRDLRVRFLMNAGIFEPGLVPSGLHVEQGRELRPINLRAGEGNFFLQPNGVLLIDEAGVARIMPSRGYRGVGKTRLAIQSGPLLLQDGRRHPAFRQASKSIKHRNGVGVDRDGRLVFAMTDKRQEVNFWNFSGLFLKLACRDALFLDGDISQMAIDPGEGIRSNRFAAMFVVVE